MSGNKVLKWTLLGCGGCLGVGIVGFLLFSLYVAKVAVNKLGYIGTATQFVTSLKTGQFDVARTDLDSHLQKTYTTDKLKHLTAEIVKKYGPLNPEPNMLSTSNGPQPAISYWLQGPGNGALLSMKLDTTKRGARIIELTWPSTSTKATDTHKP